MLEDGDPVLVRKKNLSLSLKTCVDVALFETMNHPPEFMHILNH